MSRIMMLRPHPWTYRPAEAGLEASTTTQVDTCRGETGRQACRDGSGATGQGYGARLARWLGLL